MWVVYEQALPGKLGQSVIVNDAEDHTFCLLACLCSSAIDCVQFSALHDSLYSISFKRQFKE